jgi:hypothetical protein
VTTTDLTATPAEPTSVQRTLLEAAALIETEGWVQHSFFAPRGDGRTGYRCMLGAIRRVTRGRDAGGGPAAGETETVERLATFLGWNPQDRDPSPPDYVTDWNDLTGRTAQDVVRALRMAAL